MLLSQLSQCEEEGGEKARVATDAMSLVQVSQSLGCYLPVRFLIIALLFFSFILWLLRKRAFGTQSILLKKKGAKGTYIYLIDHLLCVTFCWRSDFFMPVEGKF
jgi:hypothetical protein